MENKNYPLVIVFYLDHELMSNPQIIKPFAESVNQMIAYKNANALAFFLPTKGEDRVEVLNPVIINEADMEKVNKIIEEIKESFSIGADIDVPDEEITIDELSTSEGKPCDCGNNPNGDCKCD